MIQLTDNLEINKPAPVDDRLGVFESTAEALAYTNENRRYVGLTVIVDDGSGATEYWFKEGVTDADLEAKASGGPGATPTLAQVLDEGNQADENIELLNDSELRFGAGGGILLDNGSRLREGTIDAGTGGSKGIAQICGVGYELKWEAGSEYVMNGNGDQIREVRYKFGETPTATDDVTKGFTVGSRWVLDNGDVYICSDATATAAVWEFAGLVPYTGATQDVDLGTRDFYTNKVYLLDESNENHGSIHYTDGDFHIEDADGHKLLVIEDGFIQLHLTDTIQSNLFTSNLTQTRDHYLPNANGTIALTSDITKSAVGLGNVDNTSDANKPISTATQTALDLKAPIASPTFTGTVGGITKSMVGLGNVDNTSDLNKPISTATQTALDRITSLFQDVSQLSTTSTTAVTLTTFTVASANIPVGGVIRISGLIERTAGSGNTTVGLNVNSGGARYLQSSGNNSQFEMLICKTTSTNVRYGLGASNTTGNSFSGHNSVTVSVAQDGSSNFVISFLGFVGTAGATLTVQFVKGNLL